MFSFLTINSFSLYLVFYPLLPSKYFPISPSLSHYLIQNLSVSLTEILLCPCFIFDCYCIYFANYKTFFPTIFQLQLQHVISDHTKHSFLVFSFILLILNVYNILSIHFLALLNKNGFNRLFHCLNCICYICLFPVKRKTS